MGWAVKISCSGKPNGERTIGHPTYWWSDQAPKDHNEFQILEWKGRKVAQTRFHWRLLVFVVSQNPVNRVSAVSKLDLMAYPLLKRLNEQITSY